MSIAIRAPDMPGEAGELIVKGPQVMEGYWGRPDETANMVRNDWLYTGDLATMDEDGFLRIVGRKKDMILASGYNVYPDEVDRVLTAHPKVFESCTIGVPDPKRGETVSLGEGSRHNQIRILLNQRQSIRIIRFINVFKIGLIQHDQHIRRNSIQKRDKRLPTDPGTGWIVGIGDKHHSGLFGDRSQRCIEVLSVVLGRDYCERCTE